MLYCKMHKSRKSLEKFNEKFDLVFFKDGTHTKFDSFMCTFSPLNLGIVSTCVISHCGWEVLQDYHIGSGNFPVCIAYGHVTITDEAK